MSQTHWQRVRNLVAIICFIIFLILLAGVVTDASWLHQLDQFGTHIVRHPVTEERTWFFRNITRLGNVKFTMIVMVVFSLGLWWRKKYQGAVFFFVNVGVFALAVNTILKSLVERPRPIITHLVAAGGFSFPSGHSMNVTLMYGSLIILCNLYVDRLHLRAAFNTLLTLLIITICLSRVYLGVHFPSDVLAGSALAWSELLMSRYLFFKTTSIHAKR
ncbi:phosphatase PAP2 family protein [Furfurilactobacillus rossiae]|uniref:Phosphatidic acid phosphatase n=1 Tax=Furfurilactobacillus rossiae DSM 15814 TaxID=1114972 RepID=A0A0R1RKY0_9LACO|nr:phosphatase PAP2 family protein [Furfurilactobacillus rossiae]KRL57479.1 phosphatidic acid phosphatase [Furfurilactobacillus rossiae DSM 15814]MCF6166763.1 phosphatase PAP2 family protein [Furfurilactobacillus rossiae]QFR65660.1 phosphatase PAP2 family protein [Furfurilactobacillus rossiae]